MKQVGGEPNLIINSLYAFLSQGEDGQEGIMAASMIIDGQHMFMPLIGADLSRVKSLLPMATDIALKSGQTFRIYKFDNKVDITDEVEL